MEKMIPAYEGKENYLFVSYAHKDSDLVLPVIRTLFEKKIRVWYDEGIAPGSEWPKNIEDHLNASRAVIVFVSENSLKSPNCENEVVRSTDGGRKVYMVSLDGAVHDKLKEQVKSTEQVTVEGLLDCIPQSFVGDGVTGYERQIGSIKKLNLWNLLIGVAVLFFVILGIGLYGLNAGFFDTYLPGLQETPEKVEKYTTEETKETVAMEGDNDLKSIILEAAGRDDLNEVIPFQSDQAKNCLWDMMGYAEWGNGEMTYYTLINNDCEEFTLVNPNDEALQYMAYFPNLKRIVINNGSVTTLEPLMYCQSLEIVYLTYNVFPVNIPENAPFEVEYTH